MKKTVKISNATSPELTRAMVRAATNSKYFERGEGYFEADLVRELKQKDGKVYATVHGSHPYKTTLWIEDGRLEGNCTCPLGQDEKFCKHLVATGLTWIEAEATKGRKTKSKRIEPGDIEAFLRKQSPEALVETIMQQALNDDEFYNLLKFKVAAEQPVANISEMRSVLRQAMTIEDFISWRDTSDYYRGVDAVIRRIKKMLPKHPAEVVDLTEYALGLWEEAIQLIDDSDGGMGEVLDDLHKLHLDACEKTKPDPVALAERLFDRHANSGWDIFSGAYEVYGFVLGKTGKARYRELVESEWSKLPHYGPNENNEDRYGRTHTIEQMMLSIVEETGDLNRIIEVMSRDLSESYDFLNIAERCRQAKAYALAIQWAEQGIRAFPDNSEARMHDFLADEYVRAKRPEDAVGVVWETFKARPGLERYQTLQKYAAKAKTWPEWREKALTNVRKEIAERKKGHDSRRYYGRWDRKPDHSLLVEIFLWEKDAEAAWTEAQKGGCSESLWLKLAKAREKDHPEDAVAIYRRQVEPALQRKNNQSYQEAVRYLGEIHTLMQAMDKESEFNSELRAIKTEWKRLRNFIIYVESTPWGKA
ncbi:MAG: hypothetical protein JW808_12070 [Victivallales bacterium]|nr:hypothetical protein [Victivallales bacterium]